MFENQNCIMYVWVRIRKWLDKKLSMISGLQWLGVLMILMMIVGIYVGKNMKLFQFPKEDMKEYFCEMNVGEKIHLNEFFFRVGFRRVRDLLFVLLIPTMCYGRQILFFFIGMYSMGLGILLSNMIRLFFMKGALLFIVAFFPHVFFYVPAFSLAVFISMEYLVKHKKCDIMSRILLKIVVFTAVGILTENYINPVIMEWVIR